MNLNIEQLRQDTPGSENVLHFNNAGAALPPSSVIHAVKQHIDLEASIGGYEAAHAASKKINKFYDSAAQLINCTPDEIAFAENATRAWDMAFYSLKLTKDDKIITSMAEYASNYLAFLHRAKQTGVHIDVVKNDKDGQVDLEDLKSKIDSHVKLIAITHVPTQGGLINPAFEIGKIANQMDIPYLLDTTQSVGQMPIDVEAIGCDFLCATGRKYLRGPRGTGFLYVRKKMFERCEPPFIDLHAATWTATNEYQFRNDARRFETWEQNIAAKIGLVAAIDYALELGLPEIWKRIQFLANRLREKLATISGIEQHDQGLNKCGLVTFTANNHSPNEIQQALSKQKINVSVSLQEYARLDLAHRNLPALVRASVHYYNTEEEIERFCHQLKTILM